VEEARADGHTEMSLVQVTEVSNDSDQILDRAS